jgi:cysteine desulfurase
MSTFTPIYLDANATTRALEPVIEEMLQVMRSGAANPASAHLGGAQARHIVERARDMVCNLVQGALPEDVIFLSGGTEANNMVLKSFANDPETTFLVAPVEHASVLKPLAKADAEGRVRWLKVDSSGRIDPDDVVRQARTAGGPVVLAIQAANSETGVIQPVAESVRALRAIHSHAFVHLDAAQALGRVHLDMNEMDVDAVSFSGHKLHGPVGVGALVLRDSDSARLKPLLLGGGQERGLRAGTLNVAGIAGLAKALSERRDTFVLTVETLGALRDDFEKRLLLRLGNRVAFNGAAAPRVANTSNVRFTGVEGMRMLALLNDRGIMASQGSACSSGRPEPSSTLLAMGLSPEEAFASLRFSFSVLNTNEEAIVTADAAAAIAQEIAA